MQILSDAESVRCPSALRGFYSPCALPRLFQRAGKSSTNSQNPNMLDGTAMMHLERRVPWAIAGCIFLLALAIRLMGISWGLPEKLDIHPDENMYVISNVSKILQQLTDVYQHKAPFSLSALDPGFLNYPAFIMYLCGTLYVVATKIGLISPTLANMYLVGRCISAFFGAATSLVGMSIVRKMGGQTISCILTGLCLALCPQNIWDSHVAATDVLMTFWIMLTLFAAIKIIEKGRKRDYIIAGLFLGIAIGSKYTAAIAFISIVTATFFAKKSFTQSLNRLFLSFISTICAFFLVAPFSLLRFQDLIQAMLYEHKHTTGFHYGFSLPASGWQYHKYIYQLFAAWPFSLGLALYIFCMIGLIVSAFHINKKIFTLLIFFIVYFLITGNWMLTPLRYYLPLLSLMIIIASFWAGKYIENAKSYLPRIIISLSILVIIGYTAIFSWQTTLRFKNDTRIEAAKWLHEYCAKNNINEFVTIGAINYSATANNGNFKKISYVSEIDFFRNYRNKQIDMLQITSIMYNRAYRHNNPFTKGMYEEVRHKNYILIKRFASNFINKNIYTKLDPMFEGYFISPTLEFYRPIGSTHGAAVSLP